MPKYRVIRVEVYKIEACSEEVAEDAILRHAVFYDPEDESVEVEEIEDESVE